MQLTKAQLFDIIRELKPGLFSYPSITSVANNVSKKLDIKICDELLEVIKIALRSFQQHSKNKHSKGSQSRKDLDNLEQIIIDSRHFESLSSSEEDYDINGDSDGVAEPICKKRKKTSRLG